MKKTPSVSARWLAIIMLGLVGAASVPALDLSDALPFRQTVTEGRNVILYAEYATGSVQWQVAPKDNLLAWTAVVDSSSYHGAATRSLEIANATKDLDGLHYRYINTAAGVVTTSNAAKLIVSPRLLPQPAGIMLDGMNGLLVCDASTHTIRRITNALLYASGNDVSCPTDILAGVSGEAGSDNGVTDPNYGATFNQPNGIVAAGAGGATFIAVADTANAEIRLLSGQNVSTLAGNASLRGNVDGAGMGGTSLVSFGAPIGIARGADGSFYVADSSNHTIRKVTADGVVTTFAGSPGNAGFADGLGSAARFNNPSGVAVDANGTLYVSDTNNNLIRQITPAGLVTTLAGIAGVAGARDGLGNQAQFNGPTGIVLTNPENDSILSRRLLIADTGNSTIRSALLPNGVVTTYAGVPGVAGLQEGHGYSYFDMLLDHPRALAYSVSGVLFIADTGNAAIRAVPQYDGISMTLPLANVAAPATLSPGPTPSPAVPVAPTAAQPTTSQASTGGGGACSEWFLAALAGLSLLRKMVRAGRPAASS